MFGIVFMYRRRRR